MISAAYMLARGSWACSLREILKKNATWCILMFLCLLYQGPPDKFVRMLYAAPIRSVSYLLSILHGGSVSSLIMEASLCLFFHTIWGPLGSFLYILYWGPQITFFAYYMGPLRSVSLHAIGGGGHHRF